MAKDCANVIVIENNEGRGYKLKDWHQVNSGKIHDLNANL